MSEQEAREVAEKWCKLIAQKRWRSMVGLTQKTWRQMDDEIAAAFIAGIYKPFKAKKPKVESVERVSDVFYKASISMDTEVGRRLLKINVIKEDAPYKPSVDGEWGVNPVSAWEI